MPTTPNLGLFVVEPNDTTTNVLDYVHRTSSTQEMSNMMLIDAAMAKIKLPKRFYVSIPFKDSQPAEVTDDFWTAPCHFHGSPYFVQAVDVAGIRSTDIYIRMDVDRSTYKSHDWHFEDGSFLYGDLDDTALNWYPIMFQCIRTFFVYDDYILVVFCKDYETIVREVAGISDDTPLNVYLPVVFEVWR